MGEEGEEKKEREMTTICFGGISIVDIKKEEAGLENEMKKNQTEKEEEVRVMFLKPREGADNEYADAASFVSCKRNFMRMIIISPLPCNDFLEACILSFINPFTHSRNIYPLLSVILYNLCFVRDKY